MRTLLKPRWIAAHMVALALVVLFVNLGFWQLRRLEQRRDYNALLETRLAAEPQPYTILREQYAPQAPPKAEDAIAYRRATATGHFDTEHEILLRARAYEGRPGWHVLTPLMLDEGRALIVDRGWVPRALDQPPIIEALPPAGEVTLSGILFPEQDQPTGFGPKDPATGVLDKIFYVDADRLEQQLPYELEPVYLELSSQTPSQSDLLPIPPKPPELTEGSHLSYALQWFSFALIGVIGYGFLMRKTVREQAAGQAQRLSNGDGKARAK